MERLLHVMFRGYLDDEVSKVLVELSNFYRQFSAKEITVEMMEKLEEIDTISSMQDGEIFSPRILQSNATSPYISSI
jgi:hypothetical protein